MLVQSNNVKKDLCSEINNLVFRIRSVLMAKKFKYILMNAPNKSINKISQILPVLKSPTVLPLAKDGWSSIHSVIDYEDFWNIIDMLKKEGAEDILVCPIEKNGIVMEIIDNPNKEKWKEICSRLNSSYKENRGDCLKNF